MLPSHMWPLEDAEGAGEWTRSIVSSLVLLVQRKYCESQTPSLSGRAQVVFVLFPNFSKYFILFLDLLPKLLTKKPLHL